MPIIFNPFTGNLEFVKSSGGGGGTSWNQGGNSFGALGILGTNDAFSLNIITNGLTGLNIDTTQKATFANIIESTQLNLFAASSKIALDTLASIVLRIGQGFSQFNIGPDTITLNSTGTGTSFSCTNQISFNRGAIINASANIAYQFFNATYSGTGSLIVINPTGNIDVSSGTPTIVFYNASPSFTNLNVGSVFSAYFSNIPSVVPLGGTTWSHFANGTAPNAYAGFSKFGALTRPAANVDISAGNTTNPPLKFASGTLTTGVNVLAGNFEFLNDDYFVTASAGPNQRKVLRDLVYTTTTIAITLTGRHEFIDCTNNTFAVTLPSAVGYLKQYSIFNSGTGVITINTSSGQTINGFPSGTFSLVQFDIIIVRSNGTNWYKIN